MKKIILFFLKMCESFENLPVRVLRRIIANLSLCDILNLSSTSKALNSVRNSLIFPIDDNLNFLLASPKSFAIRMRYGDWYSSDTSDATWQFMTIESSWITIIGRFCVMRYLCETCIVRSSLNTCWAIQSPTTTISPTRATRKR